MQQIVINVFAVIGMLCLGCTIGLTIIWAIGGAVEKKNITRPLPAEPMPVTAPLEEVY